MIRHVRGWAGEFIWEYESDKSAKVIKKAPTKISRGTVLFVDLRPHLEIRQRNGLGNSRPGFNIGLSYVGAWRCWCKGYDSVR